MRRSTLQAVGLNTEYDIPAGELFSPALDADKYRLDRAQLETLRCLHDFVMQYNKELPVQQEARPITGPAQAVRLVYNSFRGLDHEEFRATFVSAAGIPLKTETITSGGLKSTVIDVAAVARRALELRAGGVIVYHNHPSGNPLPSAADIKETQRLKEALDVFDIAFLDHIIVSDGKFYSFSDETTRKIENY